MAFSLATVTFASVLGARDGLGAPAVPDCSKLGKPWVASCEAVTVLQQWYNGPEGNWEDTEFWGSASSLHALIDFEQASGDTALLPVIQHVHAVKSTAVVRVLGAGSFDDLQWWVLAYGHAHRLTGEQGFLQTAEDVFETVWTQAWDTTHCGGGLWWDSSKHYKNAITNELGIVNAALLHQATKNPKYLARAREQWAWFEGSGMINAEGLVNDGLNSGSAGAKCTNNNGTEWTYNQGVILEGLVLLSDATGNATLVDVAASIAAAAIAKLCDADGVLVEAGPITDRDQAQFKGVFARGIRLLLDAPRLSPADRSLFAQFLATNAASVVASDRTAAGTYGGLWQGPVDVHAPPCGHQAHECGNTTGATPQTSALELLVAAAQ